jgi:hypothetical protein
MQSIVNLEISFNDDDDEEHEMEDFVKNDEVKTEIRSANQVQLLKRDIFGINTERKIKITRALKLFQKITLAIIVSNNLLNRKGFMK